MVIRDSTRRVRTACAVVALTCLLINQIICQEARADDSFRDGFYTLQIACDPTTPRCDLESVRWLNGLSIVDTLHGGVLAASFVSRTYSFVGFTVFSSHVSLDGSEISGFTGISSPVLRFARFKVDRKSGLLTGTLEDARSLGRYALRGRAREWVNGLQTSDLSAIECLDADSLIGGYRSRIGNLGGQLIIKRLHDRLVGTFMSDALAFGAPQVTLDFENGAWDQGKGLLRLSSANPASAFIGEMALSYRARSPAGFPVLAGFELMGAVSNPAVIEKTGPSSACIIDPT